MRSGRGDLIGLGTVALAASVFLAQPAGAQDAFGFLKQYFGNAPTSSSTITHEAATIASLNARRVQLESQVAAAASSGQLSAQLAAAYRAQLNENAVVQTNYRGDGSLSFTEAQTVLTELNNIDGRIQSAINSAVAVNPLPNWECSNSGWTRRWSAGLSTRQLDDLQAQILARLEGGRQEGRLTPDEYSKLKARLDRIIARKNQVTLSGGFVSRGEHNALLNRLQDLTRRVTKELEDRQVVGRASRWWY